jgi:hypothetical protein
VTTPSATIVLPTRRLDPAFVELLRSLKPGDGIRIVRRQRVGSRSWDTRIDASFRGIGYLDTGITTERVRQDDVVVPVLQFTKPNGELSSITIDEHLAIEKL